MAINVPIQAAPEQAPQAQPQQPAAQAGAQGDGSEQLAQFAQHFANTAIAKSVIAGDPKAVFASPSLFGDNAQQTFDAIDYVAPQLGLGILKAPKSGDFVLFNPKLVKDADIIAADQAGTLDQLAVDATTLGATPGNGAQPAADGAPAPAPDAAPVPPHNIAGGLLPAGAQDDLTAARVGNLLPKPPVKRALPAQGIINGLVQRAT